MQVDPARLEASEAGVLALARAGGDATVLHRRAGVGDLASDLHMLQFAGAMIQLSELKPCFVFVGCAGDGDGRSRMWPLGCCGELRYPRANPNGAHHVTALLPSTPGSALHTWAIGFDPDPNAARAWQHLDLDVRRPGVDTFDTQAINSKAVDKVTAHAPCVA